MQIEKIRNKSRQVVYTVKLSEYDANPPAPALLVDDLPNTINPELEAVALFLIFGKWCGGEFTTPQKMGPSTAAALARFSKIDLFCNPIEYYPKALPLGNQAIAVGSELADIDDNTFVALRSCDWNGSIRSTNSLAVASNAFMFQNDAADARPIVGLALLYAESLGADSLVVLPSIGACEESVQALVQEARVGITHST